MKRTFLSTALAAGMLAFSGSSAQTRYTAEQLGTDLDSIHSKILQVHVSPFLFISEQEMAQEVARIKAGFTDTMTRLDFYARVTPLLTRLRDWGTDLEKPSDQIERYGKAFPCQVAVDRTTHSLTVLRDHSPEGRIPAGAEIVSINGRAAAQIVTDLLELVYVAADGQRYWDLENTFEEYYYIRYRENSFEVAYRHQDNNSAHTLAGLPFESFRKAKTTTSPYFPTPGEEYAFRLDEQNRAGIVMVHEVLNDDHDTFITRLRNLLEEMRQKGIDNLILDTRALRGGHTDLLEETLRYLMTEPFRISRTQNRHSSYTLAGTDDPWARPGREEIADDLRQPYPESRRFTGNLYLLVSETGTPLLSWPLQRVSGCTIIGPESWSWGFFYTRTIPFLLPHTELRQRVSWGRVFWNDATDESTHGVIPHYPVPATQALEKALELTAAK